MDTIKRKPLLPAILLLVVSVTVSWLVRLDNFNLIMDMTLIVLIGIVLKRIPLLQLSFADIIALTAVLMIGKFCLPMVYLPSLTLHRTIPFMLLLLAAQLVVIRNIHKRKNGYGIIIVLSTGIATFICMLYQAARQVFLDYYQLWTDGAGMEKKVLFLSTFILLAFACSWLISWGITKLLKKRIQIIQSYSAKYKEIDRTSVLVLALILCCLMMTELLTFAANNTDYALPLLWIGMCMIIGLIQVVYIRLLVKSISLKEEMQLQQSDWQALTKYNQELESNMEDLRDVKHDVKNLFLTMGGLVEQSNNETLKLFYEQNIVPFANQELQKSDLYGKLIEVYDESLKSFLYFKIMQGINQGIQMELQVQFAKAGMGFCMAQTDLIRLLGIFIDNAMEEAKACHGTVTIQIRENEAEYVFLIRNSVRQETIEKGVVAGTTDKGLGRGNGLLIANKVIKKYRNVLLNSFFQQNEFVQFLRIEKVPEN